MQTIYAVVCYHVKRKNIKLVLCARVYNEYELSRGGEINSFRYLCAKNYQHRTWFDRVIDQIKRCSFYCLAGYYYCYYPSFFV